MEVGVDVGGTFTDLIALDPASGEVRVAKVPTTVDDQSRGFMAAVADARLDAGWLTAAVHGTTVAINALLERKGAAVALLTTAGFRDVLEIRRRDRPHAYGLRPRFQPLIPRERRFEIGTRIDADGEVVCDADDAELAAVLGQIRQSGAEAVLISLFNGYLNPALERRLAERLAALGWPADRITVTTDVSQEIREFERTSTGAISAYVQPVIARYLTSLADRLRDAGFRHELLVAQSNGGAIDWRESVRLPVNSIMSGPAAGAIACAKVAADAGFANALACDVGGTSCDITIVTGGLPAMRAESELEFGLPIRRPMVDVRSIGAGGGSIARLDRGGILRVGPQSAGARPGPACYGLGGEEATITDAQVVLGRFGASASLGTGGDLHLDPGRARGAIERSVAKPLGLTVEDAAEAIIAVAEQYIAGSIRRISTERGHDPRQFALVMFGGAGPAHVSSLMRELSVPAAIIPPYPGATSALGCLLCDLRQDFVHTVNVALDEAAMPALRAIWQEQVAAGRKRVSTAAVELDGVEEILSLSCCYAGQAHHLDVPLPSREAGATEVAAAFESIYRRRYGRSLTGFPVLVTAVRTIVQGLRPARALPAFRGQSARPPAERQVRSRGRWLPATVVDRSSLVAGQTLAGPLVVEQPDATTWIEPGFTVRVLPNGSLLVNA